LFLDILKFTKQRYKVGFKFTDLANWLLDKNLEFRTYYQDSNAKIPKSARIANKRQRIQRHLDDLLKIGLLRIKSEVTAEKNNAMTPLYVATTEGFLLSCLLFSDSLTNGKIIDLLELVSKTSDASHLLFVMEFFRNCEKAGRFGRIVSHFIKFVLPTACYQDAKDMFLAFLGHNRIVNWILLDEGSFYQAMKSLPVDDRRLVYFKMKTEIENYYSQNYLRASWLMSKVNANGIIKRELSQVESVSANLEEFSKTVGLPSKQWQKARLNHANNFSKVVVPGFCIKCKSDSATIVGIDKYLKSFKFRYGPYPSPNVSGSCSECGEYSSGHIMELDWFTCAWT
jgi:hypothetical protein